MVAGASDPLNGASTHAPPAEAAGQAVDADDGGGHRTVVRVAPHHQRLLAAFALAVRAVLVGKRLRIGQPHVDLVDDVRAKAGGESARNGG